MEAGKVELKILLLGLAVLIAIELAAAGLISSLSLSPILIIGTARLAETGLILLIVHYWGAGFPSIGLEADRLPYGVVRGAIWSAGFGAAALIGFGLLYLAGQNPIKLLGAPLPKTTGAIITFFVVGGLVAPVSEEIFFRGIVYGYFRRWGAIVALVISSLVFVLAHQPGRNLPLTQTLGGIVFAVAYELEGNLMVPIMIHLTGNIAMFVLALVF